MILLLLFSIYLLCVAAAGAVYTQLPKHVPNMSFVYFGLSLTAHLFALPFLFLSVFLFGMSITVLSPSLWLAGLHGVSALMFAVIFWRALRGAKVLDNILPDGSKTSLAASIMGGLFPFVIMPKSIKRIANVAYGEAGTKNRLDIYVPAQSSNMPLPVIIHIHGGAWVIGRKGQQAKPLIKHMVPKGWIVVDINYRLGPRHKFPVIFSDVLKSIAWVKSHIQEHGGDPNFIALTGGSAGGHLTALAALRPNDPDFKSGFEDVNCSVNAAVPVYGVYDFIDRTGQMALGQKELENFLGKLVMPGPIETHREFWDKVSPVGNVHADAPPMFMVHGRHDALAAFKGAEIFVKALKDTSNNEVAFAALPSGQHAFDLGSGAPTGAHVRAVERFLNKIRAEQKLH